MKLYPAVLRQRLPRVLDTGHRHGELALTGSQDGLAFETYITRMVITITRRLAPHLRADDLVIRDILSAHKRQPARC